MQFPVLVNAESHGWGSILGALKAIVNVIGMTKMTPPIKEPTGLRALLLTDNVLTVGIDMYGT